MTEAADALDIAREVARAAADLLRGVDDVGKVRTKSSFKDLVTEWDTRAEEAIVRRLETLAPDVPRLAEESGAAGDVDAGRRWVIDPIDGTVNFAHGIPFWAVAISFEVDGDPVCGVVHAPALGWEFFASAGGGAYRNGERVRVSAVDDLRQAVLATGFPYDRGTARWANFREWEHMQRTAGACRRMGCASLDLAMVACGMVDGFWEARLRAWDLSAGAVLVREAGGVVTSLTGGRFASASGEAVASNGAIHQQIVEELGTVFARYGGPHDDT
ncbi:MAG: inositol monophosphatase [Deltaproteobacteria bacterium]|nr:MAG: inositol monophosphatase [Deltaproteobacteria bacterium]